MSDLVHKLRNEEDWSEIVFLLKDVGPKDIPSLMKLIPSLLKSKSWVVQAEIIDIIGTYKISGFENDILSILNDDSKNVHLRVYALFSCYDLNLRQLLKILSRKNKNPNIFLRLPAMCLYYIKTKNSDSLSEIEKVVCRKNCSYLHQFSVINIFEHYIDISRHIEILDLFRKMLSNSRSEGVKKDLERILN